VIPVQPRGGAQVSDIRAPAGLGDGQCADLLPGQRGADELLDQPVVTRGDHVRHRDTAGEQGGEHPAGVVDQDGRHAHLGDGGGQRGIDLFGVADVDCTGQAAGRGRSQFGGLGVFLPDRHPGTEFRERLGDPAPDTRTAAGDDRYPAVEVRRVFTQHHLSPPGGVAVTAGQRLM